MGLRERVRAGVALRAVVHGPGGLHRLGADGDPRVLDLPQQVPEGDVRPVEGAEEGDVLGERVEVERAREDVRVLLRRREGEAGAAPGAGLEQLLPALGREVDEKGEERLVGGLLEAGAVLVGELGEDAVLHGLLGRVNLQRLGGRSNPTSFILLEAPSNEPKRVSASTPPRGGRAVTA